MGTKIHCESLFPGHHHSMRDPNNESNGCRWPLFYADNKASANDQFYNDKDVVRRTMLEHEAVFKAQVMELHRVYRIQRDMMDELKRKQFNKEFEASCSSQATNDDLRKWKMPSFPVANSVYDRPSMSVVDDNGHSPMTGSYSQGVVGPVPWQNGASSKNVETWEVRPMKIRRRMIDLCLPADDNEEAVELKDHRVCGKFPNGDVRTETRGESLRVGYGSSSRTNGLADLNEPFKQAQETNDHYSGTHKFATPSLQLSKPLESSSQAMQVFVNSSQRGMGLPNSGPPPSKAVLWRERTFIDLEADTDTNTSHEVASHQPQRHLYPPYSPPASAFHMHSSWQNPSFGFPQRVVASEQRYPVNNAQKQGCLGDRLQFESNARYNNHNMVYNECSSSSLKSKFSGSGYSYPNGGRSDHRAGKPLLDSNGSEVKFVRDLNLNVTLPSNTCVVEVRKDEATLPWLVKPKSDGADGRWNLKSNDAVETEKTNINSNIARDECNAERDKVHNVRMMLDINKPCEPLSDEDQQTEEEQTGTKVSVSNKCHIDLNMSVSEEEDDENWSVPPTSSRLSSKRIMIDLETVPESDIEEDDNVSGEKPPEESETETTAAETIVAISLACLDREVEVVVAPETMILHWFAETVENLDQKLASVSRNQARSIEEIDYFESMILQLPETTEEEYTPKPLVPEELILEETSTVITSQRPRRGNARKGKQRRDFQRDILPGLVSLSKHEVTEDIHMFDGFMRAATGSSWTPAGLARKKTGSRGRPRRVVTIPEPFYYPSVQQHVGNNIGEIEDRSFAGWGKMTRRPRRQRCPSSTVTTTSNQRHAPFTWGKRRFSSKSEETMSTSSSYSFTEASCMQHWRKNWDPQRKNRLTSSTFAQAIGFWPNRRVQLWLEKIGAIEPFSGNAATCWTKIKELEALNRYHVLTGHDFVFPEFVTLTEDENWLGASPDGDMYGLVSEGVRTERVVRGRKCRGITCRRLRV
uniref:YqaJ viral recombinase domain-containing protein n=1 Tax=Brassica oleracea TaxID=3712 RepID=A0A3P6FLH2_BRAOL|nr:unnamed protein product [Brassica oleracea]